MVYGYCIISLARFYCSTIPSRSSTGLQLSHQGTNPHLALRGRRRACGPDCPPRTSVDATQVLSARGRHRGQGPLPLEQRDTQALRDDAALQQEPLQEDPEALLEHAALGRHSREEPGPRQAPKRWCSSAGARRSRVPSLGDLVEGRGGHLGAK